MSKKLSHVLLIGIGLFSSTWVMAAVKEYDLTNLEYTLFDLQGRIISNGKITQNETQIEMGHLSSTNYFLKVSQANKDLKTFKIIKNN